MASAAALAGLAVGAMVGPSWPLRPSVFALGVANGAFAVLSGDFDAAVLDQAESRDLFARCQRLCACQIDRSWKPFLRGNQGRVFPR